MAGRNFLFVCLFVCIIMKIKKSSPNVDDFASSLFRLPPIKVVYRYSSFDARFGNIMEEKSVPVEQNYSFVWRNNVSFQ